ncbi:MAG: Fur family transcriptional regulator [Candidatus Margulisiibacteriota bacterium]
MRREIEYFKKTLNQRGLRFTKQREIILQQFLGGEGHIGADELYYSLRKKYPRLGKATVYRTLKLLKKIEMASENNFTGKRRRYEHAFEHPHHDHLICEKCGKVVEIVDPEFEKQQMALCRKYGFSGERHKLQIFGLCRKCR